jgi:hypothetical protein
MRPAVAERRRGVPQGRHGHAAGSATWALVALSGYLVVLLTTLDLVRVPIQNLVLGGAVTGVIVGVAAQQPLSNLIRRLAVPHHPPGRSSFSRARSGSVKGGSSPACSVRYLFTHAPSVPSWTLISRATSAIGRDVSKTD